MNRRSLIDDFSSHLFWDVDINKLHITENKKFIIQRVLEYGLINDWIWIKKTYGLKEIASVAVKIRDLDERTCSFISLLSKIPENQFSCYSTRQSMPRHWNF
jgi:hypothetical protein